jgi:hypothetical protein
MNILKPYTGLIFSGRWEGIFAGESLNSGAWQRVAVIINESHVLLSGGNDSYAHAIAPLEDHTSFTSTVLGQILHTNSDSFIHLYNE